jgi:predicted transcriptional regulator
MHTMNRTTSTTDMEVTSIRLEKELKERLKDLADKQGYQALIRDILWDYVERKSGSTPSSISRTEIRASVAATAEREEVCYLTGQRISPHEPMLLALTTAGEMVPLSQNSLRSPH